MKITLMARAKINWSIDVLGRREDGYHLLDMVMQSIGLWDVLTLESAREDTFCVAGRPVPANGDNLVLKAVALMREASGVSEGVAAELTKTIPVAAGLGGGSADAAAALVGLNRLWKLKYSQERLCELGGRLGADVPFMIRGGLCRAQGVGDELTPLSGGGAFHLVLLKPRKGVSTRLSYGRLRLDRLGRRPRTEALVEALKRGESRRIPELWGNGLEPGSAELCPDILKAKAALVNAGAMGALMCGSGSTVLGLFENGEQARKSAQELRKDWGFSRAVRTQSRGVTVMDEQ
ncbi:4-(cytidine 5'-diphospho)-2-C-methyl-D-erythritol kinase [Gehongia tenuis]|uniref:4-diphosphocytidyl-2-C-methyl-D-erythritol kinase n=1 Tax=Gehongia tenuis TaxID=2763655 RepID=A0A926D5A7_9FIRM|nr:4-(cytidine 5'-diphospho)-2-C-methyl-D-erythritol kinase [Gehongia tenuis]MBC8531712.1 4-(cytidine 5'-diphospho)-2-C-methyl-D-erythritol kinase [Gehongia tenuis]